MVINPISPIAFEIFGFGVRWYALAYVAAFVFGGWLFRRLSRDFLSKKQFDDLFTYVVLGVILGGRLGYVLFYDFGYFLSHPSQILAMWNGGMSFHGGLIGVILSIFLFAKKWNFGLRILDLMAVVAPIGLFFGRIANFVNMEVMGRATTSNLGIVFAGASDQTPRYPSPLFEAATEGILLFIIMILLWRNEKLRSRVGLLSGIFALCYAIFRIICEQFRAPDAHIGFLFGTSWLTMGALLSSGMIICSILLIYLSFLNAKNHNQTFV